MLDGRAYLCTPNGVICTERRWILLGYNVVYGVHIFQTVLDERKMRLTDGYDIQLPRKSVVEIILITVLVKLQMITGGIQDVFVVFNMETRGHHDTCRKPVLR
ncbi:MAG: hypothetical protein R6U20_09100 [Longimonas sp.]|uniref:hypothetical protein n=1 Tax=Longimonas sp. TaxID=2039626 RepID=UPI0039759FBC